MNEKITVSPIEFSLDKDSNITTMIERLIMARHGMYSNIISNSKFDERMKNKNIFAIDSLPPLDPFFPNMPLMMIKRPKFMGEWDPFKTSSIPFSVRDLKLGNSNESVREMLMVSKYHLAYIIEEKQEENNNGNRRKRSKTNHRY